MNVLIPLAIYSYALGTNTVPFHSEYPLVELFFLQDIHTLGGAFQKGTCPP